MTPPLTLPERPRICIVMMSAVGDVVHVLPIVSAIRRHRPLAHITWILQPGPASLVRDHPEVDDILIFHRKRGLRAFLDIRTELASRPFDLILDMQVYLKAGIITRLAHAPVRLGFDRARASDGTWLFTNRKIPARPTAHVQDEFLEFLDALGVPREPLIWTLGPWESERAWQREFFAPFTRPIAAIVIATSKTEKDWPAERWAEVSDALYEEHGLQPVLVGGRSEREIRAESIITARTRHAPVSTLGGTLRELVSILDGAALVLSPDTGPLHMSVALRRPVISLIGFKNPKRVGPYRRYHDLIVDAYGDPGEDYAITRETRPGRMDRITVRDVIERVERWARLYRDQDAGRSTPNS